MKMPRWGCGAWANSDAMSNSIMIGWPVKTGGQEFRSFLNEEEFS
jgi:hypothetical protein